MLNPSFQPIREPQDKTFKWDENKQSGSKPFQSGSEKAEVVLVVQVY